MTELTQETLRDILCDDHEDYESVTTSEITGQSRWSTFYQQVFKRKSDGTFWEISWTRGSTEYQDEGTEDIECLQVVPVKKLVTKYVGADYPDKGDVTTVVVAAAMQDDLLSKVKPEEIERLYKREAARNIAEHILPILKVTEEPRPSEHLTVRQYSLQLVAQ